MREHVRRRIESLQTLMQERIDAAGIAPAALILGASAVSLIALPLIAKEYYRTGFALFVLGRAINIFASGESVDRNRHSLTVAALDRIVYASVPFAFALADSSRALAASFLLLGFVAAGSVSGRQVRLLDALTCLVAFAVACLAPAWFGVIAYSLGIVCFAASGFRLAERSS